MLSIIPFDTIFQFGNVNKLTRFSRIGKMYKLIRFTKILRFVRLMKVKHKMVRHLGDMLKIGAGTERLIYLLITFFILQHVIACLWIFIARIDEDNKENWIYHHGFIDATNFQLYTASLYFTVTTLQTVGYWDITAYNETEKLLCSILMIMGVLTFSYMTGALSSII